MPDGKCTVDAFIFVFDSSRTEGRTFDRYMLISWIDDGEHCYLCWPISTNFYAGKNSRIKIELNTIINKNTTLICLKAGEAAAINSYASSFFWTWRRRSRDCDATARRGLHSFEHASFILTRAMFNYVFTLVKQIQLVFFFPRPAFSKEFTAGNGVKLADLLFQLLLISGVTSPTLCKT